MLPSRCRECAKNNNAQAHTSCRVCANTKFDAIILCEMNRSVQPDADGFGCHAFAPMLRAIGSPKRAVPQENDRQCGCGGGCNVLAEQMALKKLIKSDKVQYQKARALQQLDREPDAIMVELKYHYAWNVKGRRCLFVRNTAYFKQVHEAFLGISLPSVRRAQLLWLAPDHIHVYCEADGERSAEKIVFDLKNVFEKNIVKQIPELNDAINPDEKLWDDAYFVETIG